MNKYKGFTLLELTIVLSIVAILVVMAAPSLKKTIQSTTISSHVNTFMADLRYARSESIRRGGWVVMCRSDAPEAISPVCGEGYGVDLDGNGSGDGWVSGWIIFFDLDHSGKKTPEEPLLRVQSPISSINSIMEIGRTHSSTEIRFTATGRLLNLNSATRLRFGDEPLFTKDVQRVVCVSLGGRARIAGNGITDCVTINQ